MIKIILGFIIIFMLIYLGYKVIFSLDDDELERFATKAPIIAACVIATISLVSFIVVSF
jgi:hypothetical protein